MNSKEKNLMFLLLACAALFVGILYSPIGSPEAYGNSHYFKQKLGVSFSGKILNASKSRRFGGSHSEPNGISMNNMGASTDFSSNPNISIDDNNIDAKVPEYSSVKKNTAKYVVANTNTSSDSNNGNASYAVSVKSNVISNQNSGGASGGDGIGNAGVAIIGKTSSGNDNQDPQPNGFAALNVDLSIFNDLTTRQSGGAYTPGAGATDPGEDPIGPPIPVPDGFWLLLFMAVGYTSFKYIKRKKLAQV